MNQQRLSQSSQYPMNSEEWIIDKFDELNHDKKRYLLVSVNIKNFKYLNIRHGWQQGNEILYHVYLAMQKLMQKDEYIAYTYGDNFALLLHSRNWDMTEEVANQYIQDVLIPYVDAIFEVDDERVYKKIYASFGIYPVFLNSCSYFEALEMAELSRKEDRGIKYRTFTLNYYSDEGLKAYVQKYELGSTTATALQRGEYQVYIFSLRWM